MSIEQKERRRHPRVTIPEDSPRVQVQFQSAGGVNVETATVKAYDISESGMAMLYGASVEVGTRCVAVIPQRSQLLRIVGKITNCRRQDDWWILGVRFTSLKRLPADGSAGAFLDDPVIDRLSADL